MSCFEPGFVVVVVVVVVVGTTSCRMLLCGSGSWDEMDAAWCVYSLSLLCVDDGLMFGTQNEVRRFDS